MFIHGSGSDGRGGSHPTDGDLDWDGLLPALPRRIPWVLDLDARLDENDAADAIRWLRSHAV